MICKPPFLHATSYIPNLQSRFPQDGVRACFALFAPPGDACLPLRDPDGGSDEERSGRITLRSRHENIRRRHPLAGHFLPHATCGFCPQVILPLKSLFSGVCSIG